MENGIKFIPFCNEKVETQTDISSQLNQKVADNCYCETVFAQSGGRGKARERMDLAMEELVLKEDYIKLGQALKAANLVESGVMAKFVVQDGLVSVNGQVETRRGKKLTEGDVVTFEGESVRIVR